MAYTDEASSTQIEAVNSHSVPWRRSPSSADDSAMSPVVRWTGDQSENDVALVPVVRAALHRRDLIRWTRIVKLEKSKRLPDKGERRQGWLASCT